jgi:hypothetical protein
MPRQEIKDRATAARTNSVGFLGSADRPVAALPYGEDACVFRTERGLQVARG